MDAINSSITDFDYESSPGEVFSVTFFVPVCSLMISVFTTNISSKYVTILQVFSVNMILLLALTSLSSHLLTLFVTLAIPIVIKLIFIIAYVPENPLQLIKKHVFTSQNLEGFNRKFIGDYRGHLLLATAICILAVDFAFFPVRFSKTETYGWSVMDAGVGSFVFVHGLCSSTARNPSEKYNFKKCMMSSVPLFILGIIRLVATSAVGYHKVVPEYGVHWNFFFTLALTKNTCCFISVSFPHIGPGFSALMTLLLHQVLLSKYLTDFILSDVRDTFVEANKEGICALLGFVSIYFCGVYFGQFLWKKRDKIIDYFHLFLILSGTGICCWMVMYLVCIHIQLVSRRMANLGYCIWVVSLTILQISLHLIHQIINFVLGKILHKDISGSLLWNSINYNGLFYFLFSNLLTGLVNLSIKPENYEDWLSFLIMVMYITILTCPVIVLYKKSIQLKFW